MSRMAGLASQASEPSDNALFRYFWWEMAQFVSGGAKCIIVISDHKAKVSLAY